MSCYVSNNLISQKTTPCKCQFLGKFLERAVLNPTMKTTTRSNRSRYSPISHRNRRHCYDRQNATRTAHCSVQWSRRFYSLELYPTETSCSTWEIAHLIRQHTDGSGGIGLAVATHRLHFCGFFGFIRQVRTLYSLCFT